MSKLRCRVIEPKSAGLSLVEVLIAIAILAILATIAIPHLTKYYRTYKFNQYVSEVESSIKWARMIAMERGISVSINVEGSGSELVIYNIGTQLIPQSSGILLRKVIITASDQSFVRLEASNFPTGFDSRGMIITATEDLALLRVRRTDTDICIQFEFRRMSGYINKGPC